MSDGDHDERGRWRLVAICGPRDADEELLHLAEEVGAAVAARGWAVACGGLGGVMEAAARGARRGRQGGRPPVIGIVPGGSSSAANGYCDVVIATGLGIGRNAVLVQSADAVVLCGGGAGTLNEAALAWQCDKPIFALADSGGWAARLAGGAIDSRRTDRIVSVASPLELVEALEGIAR